MNEKCLIGIDIGGTNIRIGAVGEKHQVLVFEKKSTAQVFHTPDAGDVLIQMIDQFMKSHGLEDSVEGISIGFPATLNRERTIILQSPNISGMDNLNVVELLEGTFDIPVCIEKDVCTALYYDKAKYKIPDCEILLGIYIGTGIGNIILFNGQEMVGKCGAACELGHIPAIGSSKLCGCGNHGCVENLTGGKYLADLCESVFETIHVGDIFIKKGSHPLVEEYIDNLSRVIATEINILDPDYIVLGGGVLAMKGFPMDGLVEKIHSYTRKPYPEQGLEIILAEDDDKKGVIGAVLYAEEKKLQALKHMPEEIHYEQSMLYA